MSHAWDIPGGDKSSPRGLASRGGIVYRPRIEPGSLPGRVDIVGGGRRARGHRTTGNLTG